MRIELPDDLTAKLTEIAEHEDCSVASLVERATRELIERRRQQVFDNAFGLRPDAEDGLAYQERLRAEWER